MLQDNQDINLKKIIIIIFIDHEKQTLKINFTYPALFYNLFLMLYIIYIRLKSNVYYDLVCYFY